MRLANIFNKSIKLRVKYLNLLCYMARIDGDLDEVEKSHLTSMTAHFEISQKYQDQIFATINYSEAEIADIFNDFTKHGVAYSFLLDLIVMALADGVLQEEERLVLAHIVKLIKLPAADYHNLINFAQSTNSLNLETMVDPMFSYVIDSFFSWGRQSHVKLFRQTSFAVDPKINLYLKNKL